MQSIPLLSVSTIGQELTLWTVRLAVIGYVIALSLLLLDRKRQLLDAARLIWSVACGLYVIHVICAFQFYHNWSHAEAYQHTADRTREVIGLNWGGGIYFNYLFTLYWIRDVLLQWFRPEQYLKRDKYLQMMFHGFIAFIIFNAHFAGCVRKSCK